MTRAITFLVIVLAIVLTIAYLFVPFRYAKQERPTVERPRFGGTYRRALPGPPKTLDPIHCTDTTAAEVLGQIYSRLFRLDPNLEIIPDIAQRYEIAPDKKHYRIWLREKVRFHTITQEGLLSQNRGREVIASDVKYTFERLIDPKEGSPNRSILNVIKGADEFSKGEAKDVTGIHIVNDHILDITLNNPFSPFISILTTVALGIVPREDVRFWGKEFKNHPVGSGAFFFEGYNRARTILSLRSNLDFHRGRPFLDRIEFKILEHDYRQYQQFLEKEIFHTDRIPTRFLKDAVKNPNFSFEERPALQVTYLGMNQTLKPFDDKNVRKAINHAINKNMVVRHILQNRGLAAQGPLPRGIPGYNPDLPAYDYNLQKARSFLKDGGYEFNDKGMVQNFKLLTLQIPPSEASRDLAGIVQANLADLGISIKLKVVAWSSHFEAIDQGDVAFFSLGWLADYPDADNILYSNFHSSSILNFYNSSRFSNSKVDQLLDQAREAGDESRRVRLYQEAEKIITEEVPWVFLHYPTTYVLRHPEVHGIDLSPLGASEIDYFKLWLESSLTSNIP